MAEFGSSRRFSDEEDPQSLLDLVDDMDLDLESSDEEAAPFDFEEYVLEHPESYALLHAIPASKLDDYWALFCELDFDGSNEVSASELYESFQVIGIPVDQVRACLYRGHTHGVPHNHCRRTSLLASLPRQMKMAVARLTLQVCFPVPSTVPVPCTHFTGWCPPEFAHMLWAMHQKMLKEPIDGSNAL